MRNTVPDSQVTPWLKGHLQQLLQLRATARRIVTNRWADPAPKVCYELIVWNPQNIFPLRNYIKNSVRLPDQSTKALLIENVPESGGMMRPGDKRAPQCSLLPTGTATHCTALQRWQALLPAAPFQLRSARVRGITLQCSVYRAVRTASLCFWSLWQEGSF